MQLKKSNYLFNWTYNAPIKIAMIYLISTVLIYFFGPIRWRIDNKLILAFTLSIYYFSFYIGYISQKKRFKKKVDLNNLEKILMNETEYYNWISYIFKFSIFYSLLKIIIYTNTYYGGFNFDSILSFGSNYFNRLHNTGIGTWKTQLIAYTNLISLFWFPIGSVYFKKMSVLDKVLYFSTTIFTILYWLNQGTLKGLGDIVIMLLPISILVLARRKFLKGKIKKKSRRLLVIISATMILFMIVFGMIQQQRMEHMNKSYSLINQTNIKFIEEEKEMPFPYITNYFSFYVSHGYTGMALAMELDPQFTYGLGSSRTVLQNTESLLGVDINSKTYTQRIENYFGWPNGMYWPTAFTWFASDISFFGIPIMMFIVGKIFAHLWVNFIYERSIISLVAICQIFIFVIYLPANNQLFQTQENFYANIFLIGLLIFRKPIINTFLSKKY